MTWRRVPVPVQPTIRIGFFGGTFDPPHKGHVDLVRSAIETLRLDVVLVCPNGSPPGKTPILSSEDRYRLTQAAMSSMSDRAYVLQVEMPWTRAEAGPCRTYDTLRDLLRRPDAFAPEGVRAKWLLLMGEDQARSFPSWYQAEALAELAEPYFMERSEHAASSTVLREYMREGRWDKVREQVPEETFFMLRRMIQGLDINQDIG